MTPRRSKRYHAYRLVFRHLRIPPGTMRPYALPGLAQLHELRWRRLRRAPVVDFNEHAASVGIGEIEEPVACSLCDGRRVQPLLRTARGYHVVRCAGCGLLYRNPGVRPERLGDLYSGRYGRFLTGHYATDRERRYRLVMDAYAPLFEDGRGRRLLDFGCGAGQFLELAHRRGFDVYGVDLSRDAVAQARERNLNAHFGAPADVPEIAAGGFDVVTMWSVLAHLATPVEDLTSLRSLLTADGALLILTVNANSLLLKALGPRWGGFTPNHLKFYSPTTLPLLLRRAGFEAVVMRPMANDLVEAGVAPLTAGQERRLRRTVADGNRGQMLRAVAFASADGPRRWGFEDALTV
jgi:SAM-dependent methyltransferase